MDHPGMSESDATPSPRRNIKLVIAYDGSAYHGWQRQAPGIDTVQERIEQAACRVVGHPVSLHGAGRTDAGVHAQGQVANFHTSHPTIPLRGLRRAINSRLPDDIFLRSADEVPPAFHASRSAAGKTYRYRIYAAADRPVMLARQVWHHWRPMDVDRMRAGARRLVGTHDVRGLATSSDPRDDTVRTVFACDVAPAGQEVHVTVQGDGFLYNMVRNIVGTLVEIGRGRFGPEQIDRILARRDRRLAGPTAPAAGLTMLCVHYDPQDLTSPPRS
jgi:tRNA pseudouridine38-40 synthase